MGKTRTIKIVLVASLIGLAGCSEKTLKEEELERKIAELQKQLEMKNNSKVEAIKRNQEETGKEDQEQADPIVVNVIDPHTKEVIKTFNPVEMGFGTNDEKYKIDIESWVKTLARGTDSQTGYDQRMILDKVGEDGQIIKGVQRIILEEKELWEKVMNASKNGGTIELPLYTTESGYKLEEVPFLGEVLVASYTTFFNSDVVGRTKNIELSSMAINNVIIGVNDIFSFNIMVGPSDAAHGYQQAPEIANGKLVDGIGGGICQTSSTLYNAVDKIGVTYIEKHHHSLTVGYVPKGRDATVSYGGLDFRFQNTTGVPLLVKTIVNKGSLTVEIRTSKKHTLAL
jgi:vancomycin resistance protein YoaR